MSERILLTGITPDAYVSDADRWALEKLKKLPLLPQLVTICLSESIYLCQFAGRRSRKAESHPVRVGLLFDIRRIPFLIHLEPAARREVSSRLHGFHDLCCRNEIVKIGLLHFYADIGISYFRFSSSSFSLVDEKERT